MSPGICSIKRFDGTKRDTVSMPDLELVVEARQAGWEVED